MHRLEIERTTLVLLAAGQSVRFGDEDKLDEDFLGKPLGLHVAVALEDMPFAHRIAVVDGCRIDYGAHGFHVVYNEHATEGIGSSVRLGVTCAKERGTDAVLIALADMPRVTAAHIHRLFDASNGPDTVVASSNGQNPTPPGLFGAGRFDFLIALAGTDGARDLVRAGRHVVTAPAELIDIDTPADLARLRALVHSPDAITRATARRSAG